MKPFVLILFFIVLTVLTVFSYGFIDPNLTISDSALFTRFHAPLFELIYHRRPVTTIIFLSILALLFMCYLYFLRFRENVLTTKRSLFMVIGIAYVMLIFSFPALTHDLFNYMTTAKVTFAYRENPYVVMPIEIPNEPFLAFTRAANKYALYGPVWLLVTAVPHYLGGGNIWKTIIWFKVVNGAWLALFCWLIYRVTKRFENVIFFALNPLVIIETMVSGHNDIAMMLPALAGLVLWRQKSTRDKIVGLTLFFSSWWVKGATVIVTPLLFMKKLTWENLLFTVYCLLFTVFAIVAPLREELYPWYAVWLVSTAALLPMKRYPFLYGFTIVLSFALELRHLPYMWMGYYEGPGPGFRLALTIVPVLFYIVIYKLRRGSPARS